MVQGRTMNLLTKSELATKLRVIAREISDVGHAGWPNGLNDIADQLESTTKELEAKLESCNKLRTANYDAFMDAQFTIKELEAKLDKEIDFHREVFVKRIKTQKDVLDVVRGMVADWENGYGLTPQEITTALKPLQEIDNGDR